MLTSNISYHPNGTASLLSYGNGYDFVRQINSLQQTTSLSATNGTHTALSMAYTYDPRGLLASQIDHDNNQNSRTYTHDGMGQLKRADAGFWGIANYTYDSIGNVRTKDLGSRFISLAYDSNKNRVSQSFDSGPTGTRAVDYDGRGNVTTLGNLTFVYDLANQPIYVTGTADGVGAANGNYVYDGNLKRIKSVVNGDTIYNVYDASGSLVHVHEVDSNNKRTDYIKGAGLTIARLVDGVPTYVHEDHLGSPRELTDAAGIPSAQAHYAPYGIEVATALPDDQAGFTGHIKDSTTGLNYMQARYYDSVMGRFLSIDPVGFGQTGDPRYFNRYAYAANDPVNMIDPDGQAFGVASKVVKVAIKGGDVGAVLAGGIADAKVLTGRNVSLGRRLMAGASLATEIFSPVSARDAKAITNGAMSQLKKLDTDKFGNVNVRSPKSLQDQMTLDAAKQGAGDVKIKNLGDANYKGMDKMELRSTSNDGRETIVHYNKDPIPGSRPSADFKFKQSSTDKLTTREKTPNHKDKF